MRLVAELDAGPVCATVELDILPGEDYGSLAVRLARTGGELLASAVGGPREYAPQPEPGVTYAEKITAADRVLDTGRSAVELERVVRALHPHVGARLASGLLVLEACSAPGPDPAPAPGALATGEDGRLYLGAGQGALELVRVRPPGGRDMDGAAYARGHVR